MAPRATIAASAIVAAVVLTSPGVASAHNDRTVFAGPAGAYDLTASVQYLHGSEEGLELDVAVRARDRQAIDEATTVTVVATSGDDRVGPLTAERFGSTYRVTLPSVDGSTWAADVSVAGPVGAASVAVAVPAVDELRADSAGHDVPAEDESSDRRPWIAPVIALAVVAYVLWAERNRRRRAEGGPGTPGA